MMRKLKTLIVSATIGATTTACPIIGCFVAGVRVLTPGGARPIEELQPGDEVWSWDPESRSLVVRRVMTVMKAKARTICRLDIDGACITGVTPSHPFYRADTDEYVALRDLPTDAPLALLAEGTLRPVEISAVHITEHPEPLTPVFNLEVQGPEHNYFAAGLLVHNKESIPPPFTPDSGTSGTAVCDGWEYPPNTSCGELLADAVGPTGDVDLETTPDGTEESDGVTEPE